MHSALLARLLADDTHAYILTDGKEGDKEGSPRSRWEHVPVPGGRQPKSVKCSPRLDR